MNTIKSIIFDLGNVIFNISYEKAIENFRKLEIKDAHNFYSQKQQHPIFDKLETGKIDTKQFVTEIQAMSHCSKEEILTAWNSMLLDLPEERIVLIKQLQKKYNLFLLSNTNEIHIKKIKDILGKEKYLNFIKLFNKIYYSHEVGLRKPDPEIFKLVLNENKLEKNEVLFIDDSIQHINSALNIGIHAFHLKKENNIIEEFSGTSQLKHHLYL
ncbi:MAG: haloacid dehalogenase [Flavobacteriales bacterium]|nr:haloacid dehalogenase [Flavobacteriales bacterium]|tara:strand:- start:776 stop:1414 length:639 start_codon:yes stop_codon:yes gene_type:complete